VLKTYLMYCFCESCIFSYGKYNSYLPNLKRVCFLSWFFKS